MSTQTATQSASKATLASLIDLVLAEGSLGEVTRREMVSAIKMLAKVLNTAPHLLPASAADLRPLINNALPTAMGLSKSRWGNIKSLVRRSLAILDPEVIPARSRAVLLPHWAALLADPAAAPLQRGLARFSKYSSAKGVEPDAVTQGIFDRFYDDLSDHSIIRSPRETQQAAGHAWNEARALVPGWPNIELTIRSFRRNQSLPWSAYPNSLKADVDRYLAPRSNERFDLLDDTPTLRPATIDGKYRLLQQFATMLVESGRDPGTMCSLADLIDPAVAKAGLEVLISRSAEPKSTRNHSMAYLLLNIARHYVRADEDTIRKLKQFCKNLAPKKTGMTRKNRQRLQQFDDPRHLESLLSLPEVMFQEACKSKAPTVLQARVAQLAVAIELLLTAPMRVKNLSELELDRTLLLNGTRSGHILLDGREVKNDYNIEMPLSRVALCMIETYLKNFHHLLAPAGCRMLFPSADGGHKRTTVLSHQIKLCLRRRCGIDMNVHLFRHFAGKIYLDAFPGAYGIVRVLLGHKNIGTTINTYCGTENAAAHRAYDRFLIGLRGGGRHRTAAVRWGRRVA